MCTLKSKTIDGRCKLKRKLNAKKPPERALCANLFYNPQVKFFRLPSYFSAFFSGQGWWIKHALTFFFCIQRLLTLLMCHHRKPNRWLFEMPAANHISLQLEVMKWKDESKIVYTSEIESTKLASHFSSCAINISLRYRFVRNRHWISICISFVSLCSIDHILVSSKAWSSISTEAIEKLNFSS